MDLVRCFLRVDGHTARWTYAMDFVRDIRLIDVHMFNGLMRWTLFAIRGATTVK